ncbi:hypothetical protein KP509_07G037400 [Ceratopteris richardii]|uniref:Uncharacterized protein n=1 Tax=Ceratopteris richardii TaxID=49495 RepID=A0A8T2UFV1_CERRI|nr:hypothetical protein KP509_07G037400 [Ceratopteris richardii]
MVQPSSIMFTRRALSLLGVYLVLLLLVLLIHPSPHDIPFLRKLLTPVNFSGGDRPPPADPGIADPQNSSPKRYAIIRS